MKHVPRIGEDGRPGSGRWCVHCSCGWSGTFDERYRFPKTFSFYADWPPKPTVYESFEAAELIWAEHAMEQDPRRPAAA